PVPIARVADDALTFVDLSGYHTFFSDLDSLFPEEMMRAKGRGPLALSRGAERKTLVVHTVGSFEASYVPSLADFDRLDPRFRLPAEIWEQRPEYQDFGFAVFKLRKGKKKAIHPMAFRFETRDEQALFFPTLHVHDGALHDRADFDHALFYQAPTGAKAVLGDAAEAPFWLRSSEVPAEQGVDIGRALGAVAPGEPVFKWALRGLLPNRDARILLDPQPRRDAL
ncbi:MAG: hypothetical protein ABI193_15160, partial [Minicystis sp.]